MNWAIDHIGFTVSNLDQAVDFFQDALNCEVVLRAGPYPDCGYIWPGEPSPEPATVNLAVLRYDDTHNIELLEYQNTRLDERPEPVRPCERGAAHFAIYVDDVPAALGRMLRHDGVRPLGAPMTEDGGPLEGLEWVYVATPWGLIIELLRWPLGMPYEQTTDARLIEPTGLHAHTH